MGGGGSGAGSTSTTTSTSSGTTSSTTATGTSTGSETTTTSTTTWGPGVCNVGSCEDCLAGGCTQTACEAEIATCDATPDCPDLFDCIWSCSSDLCQEQCMSLYPTGYDPLMALFTCEHCYACFDDCDPDCPVVY